MEDQQLVCIERTFQYCYIRWTIRNFSLLACSEEFVLHSSEFEVNYPEMTMWRLGLKSSSSHELGDFSICLERLETEGGPETVWVNWKASIMNHKLEERFSTECKIDFEKKCEVEMELLGFQELYNIVLHDDLPDVLEICCQLIVDHRHRARRLRSEDMGIGIGLQSLSNDMKRLFKCSSYYDIALKVEERSIRAHRSILSARNRILFSYIETNKSGETVYIPFEHYEALSRVLRYIYTGDVQHVVQDPSLSLLRCIESLEMEEIVNFYSCQYFMLQSTITADEYTFTWPVADFDTEDYICSPFLREDDAAEVWQLHLFPRSTDRNSSNMDLFVEYVSGEKCIDVSVEIIILDPNDGPLFEGRRTGRIQVSERLPILDFISRLWLLDNIRKNEMRIICIVRVSNGETISRLVTNDEEEGLSAVSIQVFYSGISINMQKLLLTGFKYDVVLRAEGKNCPAHKCILTARSKTFASILKKSNKTLIELNTSAVILKLLLKYIYCGAVPRLGITHLKRLYDSAQIFGVPSLASLICSQNMKTLLAPDTVSDILEFAETNNEEELKSAALEFVSQSQD